MATNLALDCKDLLAHDDVARARKDARGGARAGAVGTDRKGEGGVPEALHALCSPKALIRGQKKTKLRSK